MKTPRPRVLLLGGGMILHGGAERMVLAVMRVLQREGAAIHVLLNDWASDEIAAEADRAGLSWSTIRYHGQLERRSWNPLVYVRLLRHLSHTAWDSLVSAWRFRPTHIVVAAYDIVIRHWPALLILRLCRRAVVMKMCNAPDPSPFHRRLWRWVVSPAVSTFVCNSEFTRRELLACGIPPRKMSLVYETLPVRPVPFSTAGERHGGRLVFVGQIIPVKGLHVLLDAMDILLQRGHDVSLDVVGRMDGWMSPVYGDYRERVRRQADSGRLAGRVDFRGWLENVPEVLARATLHCCPSDPRQRESFGLVVLEAKAAGLPSVVFNSGALPELVRHRIDGWIAEEVSAAALADGCEFFLRNPDLLKAAGEAAAASVERFSEARFADGWRRVVFGAQPEAADSVASLQTAR